MEMNSEEGISRKIKISSCGECPYQEIRAHNNYHPIIAICKKTGLVIYADRDLNYSWVDYVGSDEGLSRKYLSKFIPNFCPLDEDDSKKKEE
jgi:hypothetical protein